MKIINLLILSNEYGDQNGNDYYLNAKVSSVLRSEQNLENKSQAPDVLNFSPPKIKISLYTEAIIMPQGCFFYLYEKKF